MIELGFMKERLIEARSVNISRGGILCSLQDPIEAATSVSLMLGLPSTDEVFSVSGVVVRCDRVIGFLSDRFDVGVEFIDPPAGLLSAIEAYAHEQGEPEADA